MSEQRTFTLEEIEQRTGFDKRTIAYYVQQGLLPKVGRRGPKTRYPKLFMDRLEFVSMIRKKQDLGEVGNLTLADIRDILTTVSPETIAGVVAGEKPLQAVDSQGTLEPPAGASPASDEPSPTDVQTSVESSVMAGDGAKISEGSMDVSDTEKAVLPDPDRKVRLGLMDAHTSAPVAATPQDPTAQAVHRSAPVRTHSPGDGEIIRPVRRYEDEIKQKNHPPSETKTEVPVNAPADVPAEGSPPSIQIERLGWFLARLQRAMTGDRRRKSGTTESWQRAMVTPELTMSARNLKDDDAYLLEAVARILKKLLWEAWEE